MPVSELPPAKGRLPKKWDIRIKSPNGGQTGFPVWGGTKVEAVAYARDWIAKHGGADPKSAYYKAQYRVGDDSKTRHFI